jgi:hypothetical protein
MHAALGHYPCCNMLARPTNPGAFSDTPDAVDRQTQAAQALAVHGCFFSIALG